MGAWGYGMLDNDRALDLLYYFEDLLVEGRPEESAFYKTKDTYIDYNEEILALAHIMIEKTSNIPDKDFIQLTIEVMQEELSEELLSKWDNKEERIAEIIELKIKLDKLNTKG